MGVAVDGNVTGVGVGNGVGNTIAVGVGCDAIAVRRAASIVGCRSEVPPQVATVILKRRRRAKIRSFPM